MEIDKEKVAAKASEITGQAKDLLSKVDAEKAMNFTNRFMAGVFKFGKIIAALFMFLCILVMAGSLVYYVFAGASSVKVPDFDDEKAEFEAEKKSDSDASKVSNKLFKELRDKYGSKVDDLIEVCGLDAKKDYNMVINTLAKIDADLRGAYIKGAIAFAKDYKSYAKTSDKVKFSGEISLMTYDESFQKALGSAEASKAMSELKRTVALATCGGALLGLILFLIIPLLIQIEENTRK